jgi:hypothetical protein
MRRYSWDPNSVIEVSLEPVNETKSSVYWQGQYWGTVEPYEGKLKIKIPGTRLIRSGKPRKFWQATPPNGSRSSWDHPSRADAIRYLLP